MRTLDVLRFSGGALRGHSLRTGLSMVGVAIGVCAVVLLTGLGEGARRYVTDEFTSLGTNILIVVPGRTETTGGIPGIGGTPEDLTIEDARALVRRVPSIRLLAPVSSGNEEVSYGNRSRQVAVIGSTREMMQIRGIRMHAGQYLPEEEWNRGSPVAVIGYDLQESLFPGESPVGKVIRVGDFRMRVIGVTAPRGVTLGVDLDRIVMVPVATGMQLFNRSSLFRIMLTLDPLSDIDAAMESITQVLRERHDGEEDFTLITQDAVMTAFSQIFQALTAALAGIAAISLSVAGIGIMNVMLVAVAERTREIGLLKAVGAQPGQILAAFLVEAVILSLAGGVAGLGVAWIGVTAVNVAYPVIDATPPGWAVAAALALSLCVGGLFGVLPARQATRQDPITALRS